MYFLPAIYRFSKGHELIIVIVCNLEINRFQWSEKFVKYLLYTQTNNVIVL